MRTWTHPSYEKDTGPHKVLTSKKWPSYPIFTAPITHTPNELDTMRNIQVVYLRVSSTRLAQVVFKGRNPPEGGGCLTTQTILEYWQTTPIHTQL